MNSNQRVPAEHRTITAEQATSQPRGNIRQYRSNRWPQAERLAGDIGGQHMISALIDWRSFTSQPSVCVANDNFVDQEDAEAGEEQERRFDNRMDHDTADRTVALHAKGKSWRPSGERFDRPHRNDRARAAPGPGTYTMNGAEYYQQDADAEGEFIRKADETKARLRLGVVCSRLLDLASGDSTRAEIADACKQPDSSRMDTYIDWSIIRWMRDPAFNDYGRAA